MNTRKIKILILPIAYPNVYSHISGVYIKEQAQALAMYTQDEICVVGAIPISIKDILKKRILSFGKIHLKKDTLEIKLFLFPAFPKVRWINNLIRYFINKQLLKSMDKVDLVHVHNASIGKAAIWYKDRFNIPYCVTEHSSGYRRQLFSKVELKESKKVYENSFCNIAVSQNLCAYLSEEMEMPFEYIPNLVKTETFTLSSRKEDIKSFTFITIGQLKKVKNQKSLIEAFTQAFKGKMDVKLIIVGEGTEYNTLKSVIKDKEMNAQIELYGEASQQEIVRLLHESDVFVLSSHYETFGIVLIEAMSCGIPILSTKSEGPSSIMTNDKLGILVDNTTEDIKKGLEEMCQRDFDPQYIREYVLANFSFQSVSHTLNNVYKKIVS